MDSSKRRVARSVGVVVGGLMLVLACIGLHTNHARACGAFFASETDQNLALDAQRALMVVGQNRIDLHLQLVAETGGADFSWVLPVPKNPTLSLGDKGIFEALDAATRPSVTINRGGGGGGGFCGSDAAGGGFRGGQNGVQHFGSGELGDYTYDIVGGDDTTAIEAWLTDNGYRVPTGFANAIGGYVAASVFVAVKLSASASTVDLQPLIVSYERPFGSALGYAFRIGQLSTPDTAPFVLWVLADKRYRIANYGSVEVSRIATTMRDEGLDYDGAVDKLTTEAGGRLAIVEFAGDVGDDAALASALGVLVGEETSYLTRLYGDIPRAAMEDLVITFAANSPDVDNEVELSGGHATRVALATGLFGLIWLRRRARKCGPLG
jgi:hypothetical protein